MTTLGQNVVDDNLVDPFIKETRPALELLADIEREITQLQAVALQTRTSINRRSPISSLPRERLSEIFVLCCQPKYNTIGGVDSQGICPLRLSAVCKAWRDLAWTTSYLWSVIILTKSNPHALHLAEILASWIERSGNQPLSICYEAQCTSLLQRLTQETSKWMNVSIFLASEFSSVIKDCKYFPLLQHLSIRVRAESPKHDFLGGFLPNFNHLQCCKSAQNNLPTCTGIPTLLQTQLDVVAAQNVLCEHHWPWGPLQNFRFC